MPQFASSALPGLGEYRPLTESKVTLLTHEFVSVTGLQNAAVRGEKSIVGTAARFHTRDLGRENEQGDAREHDAATSPT